MIQQENQFNKENKKTTSIELKEFILLEFTKQLILNSAPVEILKLREVLDSEKEKFIDDQNKEKEKLKEHVKDVIEEEYEKSFMPKEIEKSWTKPIIKKKSFPFETFRNVRLTIPEPNLPERLRYLRPTPVKIEIDLGELNPLIKDPFVNSIECQGPDTNVLVIGRMGEKKTKIVLDEKEISEVISKFASASKIPVQEGVYKVAVGRLIFMAIISDVVGSKFIIKKMLVPQ